MFDTKSQIRDSSQVAQFEDRKKRDPSQDDKIKDHRAKLVREEAEDMLRQGASAEEVREAVDALKDGHRLVYEEIGLPLPQRLDESLAPWTKADDHLIHEYVFHPDTLATSERARANFLSRNFRHWADVYRGYVREYFNARRDP